MAQVFVVDRDAFFGGDWPQGLHRLPDPGAFLAEAFAAGRFVERDEAEGNPAWKQWIPYCMLRCGTWPLTGCELGDNQPPGTPDMRGVLLVQRTRGQSETRLHESWSIGLGGHIEPSDQAAAGELCATDFFAAALSRELTEELVMPSDTTLLPAPRAIGLINDDSTAVGRVHAGLAYCIDVPAPLAVARQAFGIREISKMHGGFTSLADFAELWQDRGRFETWSQFLIEAEIVSVMGGRSWRTATSAESNAASQHQDGSGHSI